MSPSETVIEGTLRPDGTLVLDERPDLPPGRVSIRMRPLKQPVGVDPFFAMLDGIHDARARAGLKPRTVEEVEDMRRRMRDESEEEVLEAARLQGEGRDDRGEV